MNDDRLDAPNGCLNDETLTLWTQGLLSGGEAAKVRAHLDACDLCRDLAGALKSIESETLEDRGAVPETIKSSARQFVARSWELEIVRVVLTVKDGLYSAARTTGQVLLAPWLSPSVLTRAPDADPASVVVETVYRGMRCLIETNRNGNGRHSLKASFMTIDTRRPIEPSLFILWEDGEEIESQLSGEGRVVFEDLPEGSYRMTMSLPDGRQGHLDIHLVPS